MLLVTWSTRLEMASQGMLVDLGYASDVHTLTRSLPDESFDDLC
jgi:hypothetical protein